MVSDKLKMTYQTVDEIVQAIEDNSKVKKEINDLIERISLARRKKDTKNANKLYQAALRICDAREWYSSSAKAARAMGKSDDAKFYEKLHVKWNIRSSRVKPTSYSDSRGRWGWFDGEDEW